MYKVTKFDQSFKKETNALPKYYCVDNGLRQSVLLPGRDDDGILFVKDKETVFERYHKIVI